MKKNAQNVGIDEVSFNDSAFKVRLKRNLEILSNVLANPTTVLGLIIVILMLAMAIFAPVITEPNTPDPYQMPRDWKAARSAPLTPGHILGTTNRGGDVFYGVVWGARTSLKLSILVGDDPLPYAVSSDIPILSKSIGFSSNSTWIHGSYTEKPLT